MSNAQLPSRQLLIEKGRDLSLQKGAALKLDIASVCEAAGIPEPLFYTYFADLRSYQIALMQHFLDMARAESISAMTRSTVGLPRIFAAWIAYWDANLRWRPLRELAIHFRTDAEGSEILRMRLAGVVMIAQHELKTIGWPHPAESARLTGIMVVETAVAEYEAGHALPVMRQCVLDYFSSSDARAVGSG